MKHTREVIEAGVPLAKAKKALVLLHGRGALAEDILELHSYFSLNDFYIIAPQATNHTWYPYSFLAPINQNEPWLSSALDVIKQIVDDIKKTISSENIFIMGFSQGACLTLEFATRYAQKWGGIISLTGGLIGDKIYNEHYAGNFNGTKVLITNSPNDVHVPLQRSDDSKKLMEKMGATVSLEVYPNRPHTIIGDEIEKAKKILEG